MTSTKKAKKQQNNQAPSIIATNAKLFNQNKEALKTFSKELPEEAKLPSVPTTGGLFGWFNYDVTGNDLNKLTKSIQDKMIEQNKVLVRTIQEFNTIYDTFSALDKEYIQGILVSLKAAEAANDKALKGLKGVQTNQSEIKQIINQQAQIIQVLKNYKEKLETIRHLEDIDYIFEYQLTTQTHVGKIEEKIDYHEQTLTDVSAELKVVASLQATFQDNLDKINELQTKQARTVNQLFVDQEENITKLYAVNKDNTTKIKAINDEVSRYELKLTELKQLIQADLKKLSEQLRESDKERDEKIDLIRNDITKIEQEKENLSTFFKSELLKSNQSVMELNKLTSNLTVKLKTTQLISFISLGALAFLVILLIGGVL
ncbi:MAG: hypothetical protein GX326_01430 [Clostridiaceae bacterium]|nr:hypothetical protein [Clostridiaceae bacterium]